VVPAVVVVAPEVVVVELVEVVGSVSVAVPVCVSVAPISSPVQAGSSSASGRERVQIVRSIVRWFLSVRGPEYSPVART
jgi:hypothetical protein